MQRCWRNRKTRMMWPSMDKLRALFMDQKALDAGAADSIWYKPAALAIREALRTAPEVTEALRDGWESCTAASSCPDGLDYNAYSVMCRKMYLAAKLEDGEGDVDPAECNEHMNEDWQDDTGGASLLSEQLFNRCARRS